MSFTVATCPASAEPATQLLSACVATITASAGYGMPVVGSGIADDIVDGSIAVAWNAAGLTTAATLNLIL